MTKLLIFIFALILPGYYAHSKINCNPPGSPTITPSSLTCNGGFFSSSFRPKSTALSSSEVFLDNVQSCNLNNNLNNLLDLQPLSVRSNQIIMLEDNWKKE